MNVLRKLKQTYYMPGVDDRWWMDRLKRRLCRPVPKFPRMVQIQTRTGCNSACVFCPCHDAHAQMPQGVMSDELFTKIVDEIAIHGVTQRISPYLMNEPFLDACILDKARHIKRKVPWARIVLTTNGSLLTPEIVENLVRNNPLRALYVSMQGVDKAPYEETMGGYLPFEQTLENIEHLVEQRNRQAPDLNIVVTMVQTNRIDTNKAIAYWRSRGVHAKCTKLESRAGNNRYFDELRPGQAQQFRDCVRLLKNAYILFNGDMVLCCTDYYKTMVLGNVATSSIFEIWNSPHAIDFRRQFLRGNLEAVTLCHECYVVPLG